jgi:hypothetical protein
MGFGIRREKSHSLQFNSGAAQVTASSNCVRTNWKLQVTLMLQKTIDKL